MVNNGAWHRCSPLQSANVVPYRARMGEATEEIDLQERFPDLKPIKRPPSLGRLNGFGFGMYGHRDDDPETGTYVSTLAFSALWIPLLALSAYRVAAAEGGGWYFIGRVPLSSTAKLCNVLVLLGVLSLGGRIGWSSYNDRPDVRAAKQIAVAESLLEEDRIGDAAEIYRDVGAGSTKHAALARSALMALIRNRLEGVPEADAIRVVRAAIAMQRRFPSGQLEGVRGEVVVVAQRRAPADPGGAMRLLETVQNVGEPMEAESALRRRLLEQLVESDPENVSWRSALAVLCEASDDLDRCRALLEPHREQLGDSEGARILGQLEVRDGNLEAALALLAPYVEPRIEKLRATEKKYDTLWEWSADNEVKKLNAGEGPEQFYRKYERADKLEQQRLVDEYVAKKLERDWGLAGALADWQAATAVVPAAIDLGLVRLRLAQRMPDGEPRKAELEKAEKLFLATRSVSGESDEYRLFLGQVYYWMGRADEGKQLFDELLDANQRSSGVLVQLCSILRELGAFHEAEGLAREAHEKLDDGPERQNVAFLLAMTVSDNDDEIGWLEKSDQGNARVRAALSSALGRRALGDSKRAEAARHLRSAIDAYASLPREAGALHNGAITCLQLMSIEFDPALLDRAIAMLEQANKSNPDGAITMSLLASAHWERALQQTLQEKMDLKALQLRGDTYLVTFLYRAPAQRVELLARLSEHRDTRRARQLLDKAYVIAPRNLGLLSLVLGIEGRLRAVERLRRIRGGLRNVRPDMGQARASTMKRFTDEAIEEEREQSPLEVARLRAVLAGLPSDASAETRAVALVQLMRELVDKQRVGGTVDPTEVLRLAREAQEAAPSSATDSAQTDAHLFAAHVALLATQPEYRRTCEHLRGGIGVNSQVAMALARPGPLHDVAAALPDVQRAVSRILAHVAVWPTGASFEEWAVVHGVRPADAGSIAESLGRTERNKLLITIGRSLWSFAPADALQYYWWYRMVGDEQTATAVLEECRKGGAPTPFWD